MGYDIYEEIRWLGKDQICEFHAKENGFLLGQGKIDFVKVRQCINDIGYTGWLQIEGAIPEKKEILESYQQNIQFMRSIFHNLLLQNSSSSRPFISQFTWILPTFVPSALIEISPAKHQIRILISFVIYN
jgi:hypothetical protein